MYAEKNTFKYIIKINQISIICGKPALKIIFTVVQLFPLCGPPISDL